MGFRNTTQAHNWEKLQVFGGYGRKTNWAFDSSRARAEKKEAKKAAQAAQDSIDMNELDAMLNASETKPDVKAISKKRGRKSIKDRIASAKPGDKIHEKDGYWLILPAGVPTWVAA